ncbi:MAG TPA: hypothetical protein VJN93_09875 [Candidatus Acidoferrum sp.]|nr:hypothetical protein [Candidatus Acidoferrum sp.]
MKSGGLFFAAFLVIAGMLRVAGPAASGAHETTAGMRAKEGETGETAKKISSPYPKRLAEEIEAYFGSSMDGSSPNAGLAQGVAFSGDTLKLAHDEQKQFVIALVPDPVHTRLALFFDRSLEAIQQAVQMKGYAFDRSVMPWDRPTREESSNWKARAEQEDEQRLREAYPGLMMFRRNKEPESSGEAGTLFVLVVSETPTAGINRLQFRNSLDLISQLRGTSPLPHELNDPLLIQGPTFSGSLESLEQELQRQAREKLANRVFVYSGTVTGPRSIAWFGDRTKNIAQFASFQENDDYTRAQFLQYICDRGYEPREVAILSEDETVYGSLPRSTFRKEEAEAAPAFKPGPEAGQHESGGQAQPDGCRKQTAFAPLDQDVLKIHFPREISYFRFAYQKAAASQTASSPSPAGAAILQFDASGTGSDDDSVAPYATAQTPLSQEAVMLGIVSQLQKHQIKFTLLLASDPVDDLFLAGYLRKAYAQGQVVITVPDLLFPRAADPNLRGVLALNTYSLIPGLSDHLCRQKSRADWHEDRLFVSSGSVGIFNAMVALLSATDSTNRVAATAGAESENGSAFSSFPFAAGGKLPDAPYADYASGPEFVNPDGSYGCVERPLLWLTVLGRDGFWPIAGIDQSIISIKYPELPIAYFSRAKQPESSLLTASGEYGFLHFSNPTEEKLHTPPAWNIAYFLCLLLLIAHAILSWTGSILADSEARAQFARSGDVRGAIVLAIGALTLASGFVLVMCTRNPEVTWSGFSGLTLLLWSPYLPFVCATIWDLANLRHQRLVAAGLAVLVAFMTWLQLWLTLSAHGEWRVYWSTRMLYLTSGVSPVLPVLLLMAAVYWWMWISLRGVCLVDLRRPRLPEQEDLPADAFRISDTEGEELRETAHPFYFSWRVLLPVIAIAAVLFTVLNHSHPVQTIEGEPYDIGYAVFLGVLVASFLGCLLKLVFTWLKCRQVLAGLDRLPLRAAFCRMKDLSWHSFWNPGGSTLRETYKVIERALENQARLLPLVEDPQTRLAEDARTSLRTQILRTNQVRAGLIEAYGHIVEKRNEGSAAGGRGNRGRRFRLKRWLAAVSTVILRLFRPSHLLRVPLHIWWWKKSVMEADYRKGWQLKELMKRVECLQKEMAKTAAVLIRDVLKPEWAKERALVVSADERLEKQPLLLFRALAEEFAALVYVNFLVSVLLRIRTLVICAAGIYVFLVLSMNTYPFEPRPALQSLAVILLLAMAAAVGYVYAEMHREAILSHLTSTEPGELGLDFWIKFLSAGAIPVFSLLAAQFPSINQFLFSWLEPALQAMK